MSKWVTCFWIDSIFGEITFSFSSNISTYSCFKIISYWTFVQSDANLFCFVTSHCIFFCSHSFSHFIWQCPRCYVGSSLELWIEHNYLLITFHFKFVVIFPLFVFTPLGRQWFCFLLLFVKLLISLFIHTMHIIRKKSIIFVVFRIVCSLLSSSSLVLIYW